MPTFQVFIDEAGDPGVKPKVIDGPHLTDWFVVSAVVVSYQKRLDVVDWVRDMNEAVRNLNSDALHYRNLSEPNRARVCRMLGRKPCRIFAVASHKDSMRRHYNPNLGRANDKIFYNWCLRLLLERVTEWCYLWLLLCCGIEITEQLSGELCKNRNGHILALVIGAFADGRIAKRPAIRLGNKLQTTDDQWLTNLVARATGFSRAAFSGPLADEFNHLAGKSVKLVDIQAHIEAVKPSGKSAISRTRYGYDSDDDDDDWGFALDWNQDED
ncbi:hypothetical protein OVY29_12440 [Sphingopyxis sp. SE2]|uniref:hypothetical protein n=1 Tax=Sphingopyxis sp. SE2 TaxID=1586240 RepID=UPI0028C2D4C4|nr:hypothetical protein [Sphingopyxis sp. SE2]MDT7529474.1 hypothetical protein [Sphingopyxis sp. SE2]